MFLSMNRISLNHPQQQVCRRYYVLLRSAAVDSEGDLPFWSIRLFAELWPGR